MKRKFLALTVVLAVLASMIVTNVAFADTATYTDTASCYSVVYATSNMTADGLYDPENRYAVISSEQAHSGENSLKMKMSRTDVSTMIGLRQIVNVEAGAEYLITFYAYDNTNAGLSAGSSTIAFGTLSDTYWSRLTVENQADGWIKYTATAKASATGNNPQHTLYINFTQNGTIYLDDISIQKKLSDGTYAPSCLMNGSFEYNGMFESEIPDLTQRDLINPKSTWANTSNATGAEHGWIGYIYHDGNITSEGKVYSSTLQAAEGKRSLKIEYSATRYTPDETAANPNFRSLMLTPAPFNGVLAKSSSQYTLSMWVYTDGLNDGLVLRTSYAAGGVLPLMNNVAPQSEQTRPGWTKISVTFKEDNTLPRFDIFCRGPVNTYIDDVKLYNDTANAAVNIEGDFEVATENASEIAGVKLYDEYIEEVTTLTDSRSGATLTAAAAVTNYTDEALANAQLIAAVYEGKELKVAATSDTASVQTDDTGKMLKCTFTLPTFDADSDYSVKLFLWDSLDGMSPLKGISEITEIAE